MRISISSTFVLFFCATFISTDTAISETPPNDSWPQWRGPSRDGIVQQKAWPESLSETRLREIWTQELGPSYSGPIVSEKMIFVTETKDKKFEIVRALDRTTGEEVWETSWTGSMKVPFFAADNGSWIRATPALDGDRLYVAGMRDVLVCLDTASGDIKWQLDFVEQTGSTLPDFGFVSSPLVHGDHLFVQAGGAVTKLDKMSGKIVWQSMKDGGGMFGSAFSSPVIATIQNVEQLVVQTRTELAGIDLADGTVLWSQEIPAFRGMNILTPTIIKDSIFTSAYGGRAFLFDITNQDGKWQVSERWTARHQAYMSSPVVIDNHIYLHLRSRRMVCIDVVNGETKWVSTPFGKYWSVVSNGKQILALDEKGELLLINANPDQFELVDRSNVANDSWAHVAIVNGQIFVRDLSALKVFEWNEK